VGRPNAVIENNTLGNTYNFAFGTLMLDNFHRAYAGDYSGMVIRNNTIECGQGFCGIGIEIGGNLWGGGDASAVSGAKIIANTIEGSVQGIMSDGHVSNTEVANNTIHTAGDFSKNTCVAHPLSLTVGDATNIHNNNVDVQPNDLLGCTPQILPDLLLIQNGTDPQVVQLYRDVLGRNPDLSGGNNFTASLQSGHSLAELRSSMAHSAEASALISALYRPVLKREPDAVGLNGWIDALAAGAQTVDQVRTSFLLSPEGLGHAYDQ
jgi:hypothetical protein